jgi:hypothetical protein
MSKDCPCEANKQSKHSPSKVSNTETLLYVLIEAHNYAQNDITPIAFSRTELRESRVSVSRKKHATREILQQEVIDVLLEKDPRRQVIGILKADCGNVRALKTEEPRNKRSFCVVDDGTLQNIGHAHLGFSEITKQQPKNLQTANRRNLILLFGKQLSIDDVYN